MALYEISFTVTRDAVNPATPQRGGYFGDHNEAQITFTPTFSGAAGYQYRVEITNGNGAYDFTDLMSLQNGKVVVSVPFGWTAAGLATLRLVAVKVQNGEETERFNSAPAYVYFEDRNNGESLWEATKGAWQSVVLKALQAAENAAASATAAATSSGTATSAAGIARGAEVRATDAETVATQKATEAIEAAGIANDSAVAASTASKQAEESVRAAELAMGDAITAESNARSYATAAELAKGDAVLAAATAAGSEERCVNYSAESSMYAAQAQESAAAAELAMNTAVGAESAAHAHATAAEQSSRGAAAAALTAEEAAASAADSAAAAGQSHNHTATDIRYDGSEQYIGGTTVEAALNNASRLILEAMERVFVANEIGYVNPALEATNVSGALDELTTTLTSLQREASDIDAALDGILEIQQNLIGGGV